MSRTETMFLDGDPSEVPKARRRAREFGVDGIDGGDAALVVTELVTNAVLHGRPPIELRLLERGPGLRIEVEDRSTQVPLVGTGDVRSMTGRGLGLVDELSGRWGVEVLRDGKRVWAELLPPGAVGDGGPAPVELAEVAEQTAADRGGEPTYEVRLGAVPTDLLVAAKAHIDGVVRELTLVRAEGALGGLPLDRAVSKLITTVTESFAESRAEMKAQALAAAHRSDPETELVLHLPASAIGPAEAYRDALDESDHWARAARLLSLVPPVGHRVFRQWYLSALIEQLRAVSEGRPGPRPPRFSDALLEALDALGPLRDAADQLQLVRRVAAELAAARSVHEAAESFCTVVASELGTTAVRVLLADEPVTPQDEPVTPQDGPAPADEPAAAGVAPLPVLRQVAAAGGVPGLLDPGEPIVVGDDVPVGRVVRAGRPLVFVGRAAIEQGYPPAAGRLPGERTLHLAPLRVAGQVVGCLSVTFPMIDVGGGGEAEEAALVGLLADVLAQAVGRTVADERLARTPGSADDPDQG